MPRINRAIELLGTGQPVYCTSVAEPSYARGLEEAKTWADYLTVDLEHHPFAPAALLAFMHGLVEGGRPGAGTARRPSSSPCRWTVPTSTRCAPTPGC
jgi:4-hydroxy-2-oxoheptanedioate aldolase